MNCCKEHLSWLKRDLKKYGWVVAWVTPDADRRCRCGVEKCKNRAYYEVGYGTESLEERMKGHFVPLKETVDGPR